MDLKIRVYLVLLVLGIALHHVQAAGRCDWPLGTCTYIYDPCPPNWERCPQYDNDCPLATNHCCCRKRIPSIPPPFTPRPAKNVCDWPRGTCTYIYDPCPPNWERCPQYDRGCTVATNHCCCRKNPPVPDKPKKSAPVSPRKCDWPRGTCTYIYDPCPPDWERCPQYDDCPLATNHCCCRKRIPSIPPPFTPRPAKNVCDWPRGTCTYIYDPCPPNWERCPQYDRGCTVPTNHCCCRKNPPVPDEPKKPAPTKMQDRHVIGRTAPVPTQRILVHQTGNVAVTAIRVAHYPQTTAAAARHLFHQPGNATGHVVPAHIIKILVHQTGNDALIMTSTVSLKPTTAAAARKLQFGTLQSHVTGPLEPAHIKESRAHQAGIAAKRTTAAVKTQRTIAAAVHESS